MMNSRSTELGDEPDAGRQPLPHILSLDIREKVK